MSALDTPPIMSELYTPPIMSELYTPTTYAYAIEIPDSGSVDPGSVERENTFNCKFTFWKVWKFFFIILMLILYGFSFDKEYNSNNTNNTLIE